MNPQTDSNDDICYTPPEILEQAATTSNNLLPMKSKDRYESVFKKFMNFRSQNHVKSFSENVLLAYFGNISKEFKPSSLWAIYSIIRNMLSIKENIDIATYPKLKVFLKRQSDGFRSKKSKTLTAEEINRFIKEAPNESYLFMKVRAKLLKK